MLNMRPFQIILIAGFLLVGLIGIAVFAMYSGISGEKNPYGTGVVIWGTLDDEPILKALSALGEQHDNAKVITYVEKDSRTFDTELVNALAEGNGPDLIILPHDMLITERARLSPIPYESYPIRTFKDLYIDGAEVFMLKDGIFAFPIAVDPLLMYWNKDTFATHGFVSPPSTWEEMVHTTVPSLVERDFSYNITRTALAFGEYVNVHNAKSILSLLFMQAGSVMATEKENGKGVYVSFNRSVTGKGLPPAVAGLSFYTQFSNPVHELYTWNRSLPSDRDQFLSGDLALYFGFASEIDEIRNGNPNLNFDVAEVPQGQGVTYKQGYGTFYGIARLKNSANGAGATQAMYNIVSQSQTEEYANAYQFGSVYRASHQKVEQDPFLAVVERASLVVRGWLDPNPQKTDTVFKQMIEDVTSGRLEVEAAITDAEGRLQQ